MVPRLTELVDFARKSRIPMVWTQSDHSPPYGGIMLKKFSVIANQRILWPGDVSFNFYANMPQPHESELEHIIVKHKYDAFFETPLDAVLRFHKVDTVIISGTATNACCESTARSAFMRDYNVIFLSDLTATFDAAMHEATLRNVALLFGRVMTTAALPPDVSRAIEELEEAFPACVFVYADDAGAVVELRSGHLLADAPDGADVAVRSFIRCGHDVTDGTIAAIAAEDDIAAASGISRPTGQRARDRIADDGRGVRPLGPPGGRPVKSAR